MRSEEEVVRSREVGGRKSEVRARTKEHGVVVEQLRSPHKHDDLSHFGSFPHQKNQGFPDKRDLRKYSGFLTF